MRPSLSAWVLTTRFFPFKLPTRYHRPLLFWNTVSSVDLHPLLDKAPRRETVEPRLRRYLDE